MKRFGVLSAIASEGGARGEKSEGIVKSERARCSEISEDELVVVTSASYSVCQSPPADSTESKGGAAVSKRRVYPEVESQGEGLEAPLAEP